MDPKRPKPISNWPLLSPRRPRSPSSFCSSSAFSSRVPSFSSDVAEDWSENMEEGEIFRSPNLKAFTFKELKRATGNYHSKRFIGEGGFGRVYKGWIDEQTLTPSRSESGMAVAVKIVNPDSIRGHAEWQTEVYYLGQLYHPNVVKLIGFCSEDDHLALVYEYVQRGRLDNHLFKGDHPLSWALRLKVAIGVAKGLLFLHDAERPIIFRDVKSSNVLLDKEFNAKLADFGLAIAGPTEDETFIETPVMGTCGYADRCYVETGHLYVKSDVYSFGVVLLELLSGLRAYDPTRSLTKRNMVDRARCGLVDKRKLVKFMDPKLEGQYPTEGANTVAELALQCLRDYPELRPHMSEVLTALEGLQH